MAGGKLVKEMKMKTAQLDVSESRSNMGMDFFAVSAEIDGKTYGCDVYISGEIEDWQDGNGLIANGIATEAEAFRAAKGTPKAIEIREVAIINGNKQTVEGSGFFGTIKEGETVEAAILREAKGGSWSGRDYSFELVAFVDGEELGRTSL